jgi:ankyrin repeat protein
MADEDGKTALMRISASIYEDDDSKNAANVIKLLLRNNADADATDNHGQTALMHAKNIAIIKLLRR